jgi:uncharacterized damage-inducible protein DinB
MNELIVSLQKLILRDLDKLEKEIAMYPNEESLWLVTGNIINPAGNLCLHLCGNLQHYIGFRLGKIAYVRNRDLEFSAKNIPKEKLLAEIIQTKKAVQEALDKMQPEDLNAIYPENVFNEQMKTQHFLIHLSGHLTYHLGQVNYHRRLLA